MKVTGIVAEYNPLHNGHLYHIEQAREITGCDLLVAVMSGNFVQRGEFAIVDKWKRAEAAVKAGVNLVVDSAISRGVICSGSSRRRLKP